MLCYESEMYSKLRDRENLPAGNGIKRWALQVWTYKKVFILSYYFYYYIHKKIKLRVTKTK